jgi:hypothetical protein
MTPVEMHYSWIGFVYEAMAWLGRLLAEKLFDVALALLGTLFGYVLAKQHIEHFVSGIVQKLDAKYLDLNRQIAFHRAVAAMLPELPQFYMRPTSTFSSQVATSIGDFTSWSTAIDPTHTPEKSLELVTKEASTLAARLIQRDLGFKEAVPTPNYEWQIEIGGLPLGWTVEEAADLTIYNWETGAAAYRHALMNETARSTTSIQYSWMWNTKDVPCGVYVGVVNFTIAGAAKMQKTASPVGDRLRIFLKLENGQIVKTHENIPWEDKPAGHREPARRIDSKQTD